MFGLAAFALQVRATRVACIVEMIKRLPPRHLYHRHWSARRRPPLTSPVMRFVELGWAFDGLRAAIELAALRDSLPFEPSNPTRCRVCGATPCVTPRTCGHIP